MTLVQHGDELRNRHYNRVRLSSSDVLKPLPSEPLAYEERLQNTHEASLVVNYVAKRMGSSPWNLFVQTTGKFTLSSKLFSHGISAHERARVMIEERRNIEATLEQSEHLLHSSDLVPMRKLLKGLDAPYEVKLEFFDDTPLSGAVTCHEFNIGVLQGFKVELLPFFALIDWFRVANEAYLDSTNTTRDRSLSTWYASALWLSEDGAFIEIPKKLEKLIHKGITGIFTMPGGFIQQALYRGKCDELFIDRFIELMEKQINRIERATGYLVEPSDALRAYSEWIQEQIQAIRSMLEEQRILARIGA